MVAKEAQPPIRTLGEYAIHQGHTKISNIAIPTTNRALDMKHAFLTLISVEQGSDASKSLLIA